MTTDDDGPPLDVTTFNAEQRDGCDTLAPVDSVPCAACHRLMPRAELLPPDYECEECRCQTTRWPYR